MVVDSGSDSKEILDEMSDDFADEGITRRRTPTSAPQRAPGSKIILGVGIVILALIVILFFRGGDSVSKEEFKALSNRLDQIERRLASTEADDKKVSSLETQFQTLNQSLSRLDGADKTIREKLDKLTQQMEKPAAPTQSAAPPGPAPKASTSSSAQKTSPPKASPRYHEVAPGETLFQIAGKYGMSVEDLRRLNKLKAGHTLHPGQKLLISTGR
jgi:LysM repeat protein